jgi:hypothetical protein
MDNRSLDTDFNRYKPNVHNETSGDDQAVSEAGIQNRCNVPRKVGIPT